MNEDFFRTDQKKCCGLCATGRESSDGKLVFCEKKGVVDRNDYCRRYKYDPLKRTPGMGSGGMKQAGDKREFTSEDFAI